MSRRAISKCYTHGWTNLNASDYQSSSELSRKWREAKNVNDAQLAKMSTSCRKLCPEFTSG